jgi:type II secretory pathway component GspD/PulD (secretin)
MIAAILLAAAIQKTVTLDVKDAKVRDVLKSMQKQCAVKNLIVDPDVPEGSATFYLKDVPCPKAFDVVLSTYRLKAVTYSDSLTSVEPAH